MNGIIETRTGLAVNVLEPQPEMIDVNDIAWALSHICRFMGHSSRFYSVAEHCIRGSILCSPENVLWFLMHDAAEAYVGDIASPLKTEAHREVEKRVLRVIATKYGLSWPMPTEVHEIDTRMLATEARELMPGGIAMLPPEWCAKPYKKFVSVPGEETPVFWTTKFLDFFHCLTDHQWRDS